jgi:hypothetical protein
MPLYPGPPARKNGFIQDKKLIYQCISALYFALPGRLPFYMPVFMFILNSRIRVSGQQKAKNQTASGVGCPAAASTSAFIDHLLALTKKEILKWQPARPTSFQREN